MDTQWIYIEGTPIALDLNPLPGILDILEIKDKKDVLYKLRIIESEALKELAKHRKKQQQKSNGNQ